MDEELITKRELLQVAEISYGALYRWKRMKLIPDDWFIHRATVTGHETFLPRKKVLQRIDEIQNLKATMSLDEIAIHFSPAASGKAVLSLGEVAAVGIAPTPIMNQYLAIRPLEQFSQQELLGLLIFSNLLQGGSVSRDEAMDVACAAMDSGEISQPRVYLLRKYGVAFCVTAGEMQRLRFDAHATLAATVDVAEQKTALHQLLKR